VDSKKAVSHSGNYQDSVTTLVDRQFDDEAVQQEDEDGEDEDKDKDRLISVITKVMSSFFFLP
jgi:hypothetical protein